MSKKSIILIIIGAIIILGLIVGFFVWQNRIDPKTGQPRSLVDYFPFMGNDNNPGENTTETEENPENNPSVSNYIPKLRQISENPVSGAGTFEKNDETIIRYIEKATGHVFETQTLSLSKKRITKTTFPKSYEGLWGEKEDSLIIRSLKDGTDVIQTVFAKILNQGSVGTTTSKIASTSTQTIASDDLKSQDDSENSLLELVITYLPLNIKEIAISPKKNKIFTITNTNNLGEGSISNLDGSSSTKIWSSQLKEWLVSWPKDDTLLLSTKPSYTVPGYLYTLNTKNGKSERIIGNIYGMTALANSDFSKIAVSQSDGNGLNLFFYYVKDNYFLSSSKTTLPEKCVWSKLDSSIIYCGIPVNIEKGGYPDAWYQGIVSFSDNIWKINTKTQSADLLATLKDLSGKEIDTVNFLLTTKEDFLLFRNKKDSVLWSLDIRGSQPVEVTATTTKQD